MNTETQKLIGKEISYIRSGFAEELTIADVADHAGFSTDYFNRLFREHTGFTVMEYVRFIRLSRAALLLRTTARDITDIAFDCGYETHESFTRAFGSLYGRSPSEYRTYYENLPMTYADAADKTAAARFLHDHPTFSQIDNAVVVDELLHTDAIRHGICAVVMYEYNGTQFVSDTPGSYIGLDRFGNSVYADIASDDPAKTAEYIGLLRGFSEATSFSLPGDETDVIRTMEEYGISSEVSVREWLYCGGAIQHTCKYSIRRLTADDIPAVKAFAAEYGSDWKVVESLTQRDVFHNAPYDEPLGIYDGETLIAIFRTCIYGKYGFRVGDVEGVAALGRYKNPAFIRDAYTMAINHLVEIGYMPFCSIPNTEDFAPETYGFTMVKTIYTAK
ncbi:MAG: helix-turn-helix transcriptional regulator [Clostridia bacterium]|nr:helix-turn-helix transcriptional regulator [Clostridia bacterium]